MPQGLFGVFGKLDKAQKRGRHLIEATMAIREGRAEAHPTAVEQGLYGPIGVDQPTAKSAGKTFADSLLRTYAARQRGKKKKTPLTHEVKKGIEKAAE